MRASRRGTTRRGQRWLPLWVVLLVLVSLAPSSARQRLTLYGEGIAIGAHGLPYNLERGSPPSAAAPTWAGELPGQGTRWEDMARRAMADLQLLTLPADVDDDPATTESAVLAGWHRSWRYVWPRDASFAAAALAVSGRHDQALAVLRFLAHVQADDGSWQARYVRDGAVPDDRGAQLDSTGWVLWSTWVWAQSARDQGMADDAVLAGLDELRPMLVRTSLAAAASLQPDSGLPFPSPDFWEVPLRETSLGTAAPVLIGLRAAVPLLRALNEDAAARQAADAQRLVAAGIARHFGDRGYPRLASTGGLDASVAFLMPPFTLAPPGQKAAWQQARVELSTPVGGLRPGVDFKDPDVAWTPQTALFALTAASIGDDAVAARYLDWLDEHRTTVGSLPEKVDSTGQPAAVAPLAWTACLVLLTLAALDGEVPAPPAPPRLP